MADRAAHIELTRPGAGSGALRDEIIDLITAHAAGCQDSDCGWCDRAARIADQILAAVAKYYGDGETRHLIEFRSDGWTIKHPLSCRPNLFDCPVNRTAEREMAAVTKPPPLGVYEVEANDLGDRLLILDRVDQAGLGSSRRAQDGVRCTCPLLPGGPLVQSERDPDCSVHGQAEASAPAGALPSEPRPEESA